MTTTRSFATTIVDARESVAEFVVWLREFAASDRGRDRPGLAEQIRGYEALAARAGDAAPAALVALPAVPRVSCLMVTRNRIELVRRSIASYLNQSYPERELVVVPDHTAPIADLERHLAELGRADIRLIAGHDARSLGALRNVSLHSASGDLVCTWDDDDIYHPDRVRVQLDAIVRDGTAASYLQDELHYFMTTGQLFWLNWEKLHPRCLPGTAMIRRSIAPLYSEAPPFAGKSEDTYFFYSLRRPVSIVRGLPYLYVYAVHGGNTWDEGHHRRVMDILGVVPIGSHGAELQGELAEMGLRVAVDRRDGIEALRVVPDPAAP